MAFTASALPDDYEANLCPADSCWVPAYYENDPGMGNSTDGWCVTRESYFKHCTVAVMTSTGTKFACYYCIKAGEIPGEGYGDGVCNQPFGTSLGQPPAGMIFPGVSGHFSKGMGEGKLQQLLCGGFHQCNCGDDDCARVAEKTRCFGSTEGNANAALLNGSCCNQPLSNSGEHYLPALSVLVIAVAVCQLHVSLLV